MRSRQRFGHLRIRDKPDPARRGMRIEVNHDGEVIPVESEGPITISELLEKLGIPSSTVLAVHDETIVPHTSRIESDISLELIVVSSGG